MPNLQMLNRGYLVGQNAEVNKSGDRFRVRVFIYNGSVAVTRHFCDLVARVKDDINIEKTSHWKSKV